MVKDDANKMAFIVRNTEKEGSVVIFDEKEKLVHKFVLTDGAPESARLIYLPRGYDALVLGEPMVKCIRRISK